MDYTFSFAFLYTIVILLIKTNQQTISANFSLNCNLTLAVPINPYPSLSQCYNFNDLTCCNSVHDFFIKQKLINLLTSNCLTKYPELNNLFCLFCSPYQPYFANSTLNSNNRQTINICKSFLNQLWTNSTNYESGLYDDLSQPTYKFDNCGFQRTGVAVSQNITDGAITRNDFIRPSTEYKNVTDFLYKILIPFTEDFDFNIVDDATIPSDADVQMFCFQISDYLKGFISIIVLITTLLLL